MRLLSPPVCYLVLFSAGLLAFAASLNNGFAFDDLTHIVNNSTIRTLDTRLVFTSPYFPGNLYRPLVVLSYALTYKLFGLNAFAYHFTNLVLHLAVVALCFSLLKGLCNQRIALLATLLFAAHPLHTEVVANVSGRTELLAAFFALLSLRFATSSAYPICASGCLFLGLLSKESALVVLILTPLVQFYFNLPRDRIVQTLLSNLAACIFYLFLRHLTIGIDITSNTTVQLLDNPLIALSAWQRIPNGVFLLARYLCMLLFPYPLSADYSFAQLEPFVFTADIGAWIVVAVVVTLFCVAVFALKRQDRCALCLAWFFVCFAVTANIIFPIGTIFAERLAYLPSIGVLTAIVLVLDKLRLSQLVYILLPLAAAYSAWHVSVWQDNNSLFSYQIEVSAGSAKTQHNYAMVLKGQGNLDEAHIFARQALEIYPRYDDAAYAIGNIYSSKQVTVGAEHWYNRALSINPAHLMSLDQLTRIAINRGRFEQAEKLIMRLNNAWPGRLESNILKVILLIKQRKYEQARTELDLLLARYPKNGELKELDEKLHVPES